MLKELLTSRLVQGGLAFLILIVIGCTLYLKHVERENVREIARTADIVKQLEEQNTLDIDTQPPTVDDKSQGASLQPSDAERQEALYQERYRQYDIDSKAWKEKFRLAFTERMQAAEALVNIIPDASPEELVEYFNRLSDAERKQLTAKLEELIENRDAAIRKLDAIEQEEPVRPAPPQNN